MEEFTPAESVKFPTAGSVHIWKICLAEQLHLPYAECEQILSEIELNRAKQFKSSSLKERYMLGRVSMRKIFAIYLKQSPKEIVLDLNPHGKPFLHGATKFQPMPSFSFSRSFDQALLAVTMQEQIGIDIERLRTVENRQSIASYSFPIEYQRVMNQVDSTSNNDIFLQLWVKVESYLKGVGRGLSLDSRSITVREVAAPESLGIALAEVPHMQPLYLRTVFVDDHHVAALATPECDIGIEWFYFSVHQ